MKILTKCAATLLSISFAACGGGGSVGSGGSEIGGYTPPPDPNNPDTYNGNYYYAAATGFADLFLVPNLPANSANRVVWNSIALMFNTGSGTWTVSMNQPNYFPGVGHAVLMGPFSGVWTTTPSHVYQYRVTGVKSSTGLTDDANPVNSGVPYDIFQPAAPTDWVTMSPDSIVNVCSVSTNSVYTAYLGGGFITCSVEVMDMTTAMLTASTVNLGISKATPPENS